MFIAMNRFQIALGYEEGFETIWRERETYLEQVPGFVSFALLRGNTFENAGVEDIGSGVPAHTLYASHTVWESRTHFDDWTQSDHFRKAHAQASAPKGTYLGHPNLELFEGVL